MNFCNFFLNIQKGSLNKNFREHEMVSRQWEAWAIKRMVNLDLKVILLEIYHKCKRLDSVLLTKWQFPLYEKPWVSSHTNSTSFKIPNTTLHRVLWWNGRESNVQHKTNIRTTRIVSTSVNCTKSPSPGSGLETKFYYSAVFFNTLISATREWSEMFKF